MGFGKQETFAVGLQPGSMTASEINTLNTNSKTSDLVLALVAVEEDVDYSSLYSGERLHYTLNSKHLKSVSVSASAIEL